MPTPGIPAPPEAVPLGPDGQPLDQGAPGPQVSGPSPTKYGFLGRLLGQKHQEEMWQKHEYAKFLMEQIDKAMNDPNNRMPQEALDNHITELSKTLGHDGMPAAEIKKRLQTGVQMKQAAKSLEQMSQNAPKPMGAPAIPAPAPAAAPPPVPQGIPKPPFDPGAAAAGSPPPVPNEPPAMAQASALSGTGDGIPPPAPAPVAPVAAPQSRNRLSRPELGNEQGAQELAAKQPAALLAVRMQNMLIDQGKSMGLEGPMLADWVNKHAIAGGTALSPGQVLAQTGSGKILATGAPRITVQTPGSQTMITPTGMPQPPQGPALNYTPMTPPPGTQASGSPTMIPGPPMMREASTRDAIDAYTAQRKAEDPAYVFSDKDLNAAIAAHHLATAPPDQQAQLAFNRSLETELGRKLTDKELAAANVKYQGMLAEGKETPDTKAMRAVAAQLAQARVDELTERNSPDAMKEMAKAWQLGIPPRAGRDADKVIRYAIAHDIELPVPLSGTAQKTLQDTMPVLDMISRIKTELEPIKNSKTPAAELLPRIAYTLGFGTDTSKLLSQLELGRITQGARVVKGSSRSASVLSQAMVHTPDAWKDSGKLMYDKISNIEQALNDTVHAAKMYGLKSGIVIQPGMPGPPPGGMPPPPSAPKNDPLGIR